MHSNTGNQPSVARPFVLAESVRTPVAATSLAALLPGDQRPNVSWGAEAAEEWTGPIDGPAGR